MAINKVIYYGETLVDMSQVSVNPDALTTGKTALDASGEMITGNNPYEKAATDTEVGDQSDLLDQALLALQGKAAGGGTASPVLQSKSVTPSESAQTVTPDGGYDGLSQVTVGAISKTYVGSNVPRKSAQTYTPGTSAQNIASGQYLSGTQTIAGDADLIPSNIKSGVQIFGVTGSYTGTGGGTGSSLYSKAERITWTPSSDVKTATISHSLGVVPDGYIAIMQSLNYTTNQSKLYNIFSYVFDTNLYHDSASMYIAGTSVIKDTTITSSMDYGTLNQFCTNSWIKLKNYTENSEQFPAGTTYEILVYKR